MQNGKCETLRHGEHGGEGRWRANATRRCGDSGGGWGMARGFGDI
jgi:hypothetical protein